MKSDQLNHTIAIHPLITATVGGSLLAFGILTAWITQSQGLIVSFFWLSIIILTVGGVYFKPWLGTYLVILTFPFLASVPRGAYLPGLKLDEFLIAAVLLAYLLSPTNRKRFRFTYVDAVFVGLLLVGSMIPVIGIWWRGQTIEWIEVLAILKPYLVFRLVYMTIQSYTRFKHAIILLLFPTLIVSVIALLQVLDIANIRQQLATVYYDTPATFLVRSGLTEIQQSRYLRATSTLGNWNALGGYSTLAAIFCLSILPYYRSLPIPALPSVALAASLGSLFVTGSSNSIVGFLVGAVVWLRMERTSRIFRKKIILGSFAFISLAILIVLLIIGGTIFEIQFNRQTVMTIYNPATQQHHPTYGLPASMVQRAILTEYIIDLMRQDGLALLTGFGPGIASTAMLPWGTPESGYLQMYYYHGFFYLFGYGILLWTIYKMLRKIRRNLPRDERLLRGATTAGVLFLVVIAVMNVVHSYHIAAGVMHFFWITIGILLAIPMWMENRQQLPVD